MSLFNQGRFRQQVRFLQRQFLQDGELPFSDVLSEGTITQALKALDAVWHDRVYSPLVTLWVFLSQVLSQDHSCRAAVARLIAHRVSRGRRPCSAETGAYCQARKRLPEKFFSGVARHVGKALDDGVDPAWLWKGRPVYMFDGTTVSMPDTPENQAAYPQVYNQKPGLGFPIARVCSIISLSCGAMLDLGISRYAGKGQGELSLLRRMWDILSPGDVLLTDALMSTWYEMLTLKQRGVDSVSRLNKAHRHADFRRGRRLGKDDHVVRWPKPNRLIGGITWATYKSLPDYLEVRETARSRGTARVSHEGDHCGHDLARSGIDDQGRPGEPISKSVESGTRFEVYQDHHADGYPAVQNAGTCPQGDLDARPGLQPDPHHHGASRQPA